MSSISATVRVVCGGLCLPRVPRTATFAVLRFAPSRAGLIPAARPSQQSALWSLRTDESQSH